LNEDPSVTEPDFTVWCKSWCRWFCWVVGGYPQTPSRFGSSSHGW